MNFFSRHRVFKWVLIGILVVVLSAIGTTIYMTWRESKEIEKMQEVATSCMMLTNVLNFNAHQNINLQQILARFDDTSMVLVKTLRNHRLALMDELQKVHPDSLQIHLLTEKIGNTQTLLTRVAVNQYQQIQKICDSSQQLQLSDYYCDMFGCPSIRCKEGDTCKKHPHQHGEK